MFDLVEVNIGGGTIIVVVILRFTSFSALVVIDLWMSEAFFPSLRSLVPVMMIAHSMPFSFLSFLV